MRQSVYPDINNADASVSQNGTPILSREMFAISAQAVVTGSATGTLKLQFSNDIIAQGLNLTVPTHWSDITGATVAIAGAGTYAIPKTEICYEYVRSVYTAASGTGSISVNSKVLGQ